MENRIKRLAGKCLFHQHKYRIFKETKWYRL
jgi:hypothetical protein